MLKDEFISKFREYCRQRFPSDSGTAVSYTNAIKYFLDFMNVSNITGNLIIEIKSLEPDIRDSASVLYEDLASYFLLSERSSYIKKGFLKAALPIFFEFCSELSLVDTNDTVLIREIRDTQIVADFSIERLRHRLPIAEYVSHSYSVRRIAGTSNESATKIRSGRKAEKYFVSFLSNLGFEKNIDFFDVANNKNYGYDVRFFDVGLEIKNIKNGAFFLSDNEIARLENTVTHLVFVDIDNGIWLLKNNSVWLNKTIKDIKDLRSYSSTHYHNLDPVDIKIIINNNIERDIVEISEFTKEQLSEMILCN